MHSIKKFIFNSQRLENIWLFITDKCNLNCDYCFFKERKGKFTISFEQILSLLRDLPRDEKYDFIISGGEPLLYWELTKKIILYIKNNYPESHITLQTNMIFLFEKRIDFLKEKDVIIEPGIDGSFFTNFKHRIGITKNNFQNCLKNIKLLVKYNLRINPTMTIHPQEVKNMFENFKELVSWGLNSIEVHPAFLTKWGQKETREFIRQYINILNYEKRKKEYLVSKDYSLYKKDVYLDLVLQPDGFVLPNWTFLAFPYKLRKNFFLMKVTKDKIVFFKENLKKYLKKWQIFFKIKRSYREFSNFNADYILKYIKSSKLKENFLNYKKLCEKIQNLDYIFLRKKEVFK